jgi:hypothetical protein
MLDNSGSSAFPPWRSLRTRILEKCQTRFCLAIRSLEIV